MLGHLWMLANQYQMLLGPAVMIAFSTPFRDSAHILAASFLHKGTRAHRHTETQIHNQCNLVVFSLSQHTLLIVE